MKILLVNKFFFMKGGAERSFFAISKELANRGHRVIHFSMQHPQNPPSVYSEYFVEEKEYYGPKSLLRKLAQGFEFIRSRRAADNLERLIAAHRPDLAHLHNIYHQITPSIIPVLSRAGIPVVLTLHDYKLICPNYTLFSGGEHCFRCKGGKFFRASLERCNHGSFWRSSLLALEAYWQKLSGVYGLIKYFIAPSMYIRDRFIEAGFEEGKLIYLPSFVPFDGSGERISKPHDPPPGNLPDEYVLYFGRLSSEKGLFTLLDAIKILQEIPLVFAGAGPIEQQLKSHVAQQGITKVYFAGHLEEEVLNPVIRGAHCVVMPSIWAENAPFTVLESAALGVPVIVSDMGGLPEMAEKLGGRIFAHGSCNDLARKIGEIWEDKNAAGVMSEKGLRGMRDYYNKEKHMEGLEEIYHRSASTT